MFKKVLATMLGAMVMLGGMTVNCYAEEDGVVAVNTAYGEVEVPYAPTRICVLDLSVMDILDTLGLGENVVVLQWHKHYPAYLEEYYNSETIISLTGNNNGHGGSTEVTDEDADPYEMYYGIDADLIIGTTEKIDEDLYAILSQIAPTVVLTPALEASENLYDAVCENAETIASIWGVEGEYESYISEYDEIYAQLCETVEGKSYVMANGNTELGLIQIGSSAVIMELLILQQVLKRVRELKRQKSLKRVKQLKRAKDLMRQKSLKRAKPQAKVERKIIQQMQTHFYHSLA